LAQQQEQEQQRDAASRGYTATFTAVLALEQSFHDCATSGLFPAHDGAVPMWVHAAHLGATKVLLLLAEVAAAPELDAYV
jgi:hypothetical protein